MRVSILVDFLRPNGAGLMALLQSRLLADDGHDVSFIAAAASDEVSAMMTASGIPTSAFLHSEEPFDRTVSPGDFLTLRENAWRWIQDELATRQSDVLFVHNCGRVLDQHMVADLSRRLPVIMTIHDEWFLTDSHYRLDLEDSFSRSFEPHRESHLARHRFGHLDDVESRAGELTIIAPSTWLYERCRRRYPGLRCVHLRNPVDPELFDACGRSEARRQLGIEEDARLVMAVGNPTQHRKGLGRLARSMTLIPDAPTLLAVGGNSSWIGRAASSDVGPGELQTVIDANAGPAPQLHGYASNTIVVGRCPRSMMRLLYAAADLVVHPSEMDNLPTVPIEAGLVGVRCIATDVGGTVETVAEADGLFDADLEDDVLADLISTELRRSAVETDADRTGRRTRQLERFAPERHLELLGSLVEGLLER